MAAFILGLGPVSVDASSAIEVSVQQARWHVAIGRLPLNDALMQLAQQIGLDIGRFADVGSANELVGPVSGSYTREEALSLLLKGTGSTYRFVNDHTVAIIRMSANPSATPAPCPRHNHRP